MQKNNSVGNAVSEGEKGHCLINHKGSHCEEILHKLAKECEVRACLEAKQFLCTSCWQLLHELVTTRGLGKKRIDEA